MRLRLILFALTGCSLVAIQPLPSGYNGSTEPRCDTEGWPIALDVIEGVVDAIVIGAIAINYSSVKDPNQGLVLAGIDGVISFGSATAGVKRTGECQDARNAWDERHRAPDVPVPGAAQNHDASDDPRKTWSYWCDRDGRCVADRERCDGRCVEIADVFCVAYRRSDAGGDWFACGLTAEACQRLHPNGYDFGQCFAQRARLKPPAPSAPPVVVEKPLGDAATPRGFFCASSPSVIGAGLCVRDKDACKTARDAALAAIGDLTDCALIETAWCVGDRCAPTQEACAARGGECTETK